MNLVVFKRFLKILNDRWIQRQVTDSIKIFIGDSVSDVLTWIIIDKRTNKFLCK